MLTVMEAVAVSDVAVPYDMAGYGEGVGRKERDLVHLTTCKPRCAVFI